MKISSLNLKKCLICSFISVTFSFPLLSIAAKTPGQITPRRVAIEIKKDLRQLSSSSFNALLRKWEKTYGTKAVPSLVRIAYDSSFQDPQRYIAIMGFTKIGGSATTRYLSKLLKDRSWMIRSGSLKAMRGLDANSLSNEAIKLLKDPALVVRSEAVQTVTDLNPQGSVEALTIALQDQRNFQGGKAQWISFQILDSLLKLKAPQKISPQLVSLLNSQQDSRFVSKTLQVLNQINSKGPKADLSVEKKIEFWKKRFS